jgi:hypothetical protein
LLVSAALLTALLSPPDQLVGTNCTCDDEEGQLKDPLIFLLTNQFVSHPQSEIEQGSSLPRLSLRSDSRAAGSSMIGPNKSWQTTAK